MRFFSYDDLSLLVRNCLHECGLYILNNRNDVLIIKNKIDDTFKFLLSFDSQSFSVEDKNYNLFCILRHIYFYITFYLREDFYIDKPGAIIGEITYFLSQFLDRLNTHNNIIGFYELEKLDFFKNVYLINEYGVYVGAKNFLTDKDNAIFLHDRFIQSTSSFAKSISELSQDERITSDYYDIVSNHFYQMGLFIDNLTIVSEYLPEHLILDFSDTVLNKEISNVLQLYSSKNLVLDYSLKYLKYFMYLSESSFNALVALDISKELTDEMFIQFFGDYCMYHLDCLKASAGLIEIKEEP